MSAYHLYRKPGKIREKFKWNDPSDGNFPAKKVIPLEVFFLFPIFTETTVPFVRITSARLHVEKAKKITGFCK